jgi:parallel beta-helix repeat protein
LGGALSYFMNDVNVSNTVDGKPIYYWISKQDLTVPLDAGYVALANCTRITVKNLNLTNNIQGILLAHSNNVSIRQNNITNNQWSIELQYSSNNIISENNITNNDHHGIWLSSSSNNSIVGNNITANNGYGIRLDSSSNNNSISGSNLVNNGYGIWLSSSSDNVIYHNKFVDNTHQVYIDTSGYANVWDDGYPSGGNYWSDYNGKDYNHGQNQDELGSDGIGDTPYVIDENNADYYPLMVPWGESYDWPMFRHDQSHTGYSASTAPNTNNTVWSYRTGDVVSSSPAVVDGRVFVGSNDNNVYCLKGSTGAKIWNYTTAGSVDSSPAVVDGRVFVGSQDDNIYCLDASTGAKIWNYTADTLMRSSPVVAYGKVYFGSIYDHKIHCLNTTSGVLIWNYTTGGRLYSSPAIADSKLYAGSQDHKVYCVDAATGAHVWDYTTGDWVQSSPAVAYGRVFVGSNDNNVYCLNGSTGAKIWNYTTGFLVSSSPAVADGKVFVGSVDDKVYCLDASTGTEIWSYDTGNDVLSSPAVADGKVFVGSCIGRVFAFNDVHDIAITNINAVCCNDYSLQISKTVVCQNHTVCINVTFTNEGNLTETTDVALWIQNVSTYQIGGSMPITLDAGESKGVTFLFNSTGLPKGNYTIFANTTTIEGETDTQDNTFVYGWIYVVHPGDLDCDGHVFLYDLTIIGTAWDSRPSDFNWDAGADIDGDCHVFLYDLTIIGSHWDEYA